MYISSNIDIFFVFSLTLRVVRAAGAQRKRPPANVLEIPTAV